MAISKAPRAPRGLGRFFRDVWSELKRVQWPSRRQLGFYTFVVIATVLVLATVLFVFDFLLGETLVKTLFKG